MYNSDDFYKGLSNEARRRILNLLFYYPNLHVNQFVCVLNLPQSKVSKHLSFLRKAGWLKSMRREKWIYYRLSSDIITQQLDALKIMFQNELLFNNDIKVAMQLLGNCSSAKE